MKRAKNIEEINIDIKSGKVVCASDFHIPFQDDKAVAAFIKYIKENTPDYIVLNGDILDMFMLSRFTKGEGRNPYEEINICREILAAIREAAPNAIIYYVIGNHETRLEKYVLTKAPELASLVEDVFNIIKVQDFNIIGCSSLVVNDNFKFKHGTLLGNKSGLSAIKELENAYMSGASGHTHRLAKFIARKAGRKFIWLETGCLCSLNPEYMIEPNWQQGFAVFYFIDRKLRHSKCIEIEDGTIYE